MGSVSQRLSVLLLADDDPLHANTVLEHIEALTSLSHHDVVVYNPRALRTSFALDLDEFDVVVIHYSLITIADPYLAPPFREKLRRFGGLKVQIIQDDYRSVNDFRAMIRELGITVLFTLVPERAIEQVWPAADLPGVERITTLAGYVPVDAGSHRVASPRDRPLDIVYRGRALPYWVGRLGQEKVWIGQGVKDLAPRYGLRCDIDWREGARIYGGTWLEFMSSGRATLGSESGATITDFDGSAERRTRAYLERHPDADYHEVHRHVLHEYEGNVMMNVVSPRVFEAVALRTALVLFPGEYSGVVDPARHCITLAKDFSNFDEVAERLRDLDGLEEMTANAYEDLIASGRYSIKRFVERFDEAIDEHGAPQRRGTGQLRYRAARFERPVLLSAQRTAAYVNAVLGPGVAQAPVKVVMSLVLALRTPQLRGLLRRCLADAIVHPATAAALPTVLEDLLKLAIVYRLREARLGHLSRRVQITVELIRR